MWATKAGRKQEISGLCLVRVGMGKKKFKNQNVKCKIVELLRRDFI